MNMLLSFGEIRLHTYIDGLKDPTKNETDGERLRLSNRQRDTHSVL